MGMKEKSSLKLLSNVRNCKEAFWLGWSVEKRAIFSVDNCLIKFGKL